MRLADIVKRITGAELASEAANDDLDVIEIKRVTADSRDVQPGDLFVAVRGLRADGHDYVSGAVERGAVAVVLERAVDGVEIPSVRVPDGAVALGEAAAAIAGDPATKMRMIGVTGTNGKTTSSFLIESLVTAADRRAGVIGTVSYRYGGTEYAAPYTTPTPSVLQQTLADMHAAPTDDAILEVSSVALSMERLAGTRFDVAAFTNLSQDHLDIHGDMETYCAAKARLFSERLADDGVAVINIDDPASEVMLAAAQSRGERRILRVTTRSVEESGEAEIRVVESSSTIDGIEATIATPRGDISLRSSTLLGHYNIANVALAVGVGEALGLPQQAIVRGIDEMPGVPGRVERVGNDRNIDILVDYAHTPDALANVLDALKPLCARRLICVFGCGGDRDPGKRPLMGAAVAERADVVIVTSDNPRSEDPQTIIDMIIPAVPSPFFVEVEREIAIKAAVFEATPGDIVLIAGKGHEDYQILGATKIHFDDREHAAHAAAERASWTLEAAAEATAGQVIGDREVTYERVVIDGRITAPGDLYVAIRGERVNGHDYTEQARNAGAVGLIVERGTVLDPAVSRVVVEDTREALGLLARQMRRDWGRMLVGVTGSAGKTTTKELIAAATRTLHPHATRGSLNNETGVPLTLFGLRSYHRAAIVEMGMRGVGQIDYLCSIAEPDIGVVVNAGVAHVGVIGSEADIVRGKSEVYARLPVDGTAVYPADDQRLARYALAAPHQISFGEAEHADVRLLSYESRGAAGSALRIAYAGNDYDATLALFGRHNAINATCALAVAVTLGVEIEDAIAGLSSARPAGMRGKMEVVGGRHLLIDCYNSNPHALAAAIETLAELAQFSNRRGFAVIGDMLELGEDAAAKHREAGTEASRVGLGVVGIGEFGLPLVEGASSQGNAVLATSPEDAAARVWEQTEPGDWILFKASRGAKLERVVEAVRELARGGSRPPDSSAGGD